MECYFDLGLSSRCLEVAVTGPGMFLAMDVLTQMTGLGVFLQGWNICPKLTLPSAFLKQASVCAQTTMKGGQPPGSSEHLLRLCECCLFKAPEAGDPVVPPTGMSNLLFFPSLGSHFGVDAKIWVQGTPTQVTQTDWTAPVIPQREKQAFPNPKAGKVSPECVNKPELVANSGTGEPIMGYKPY